MASVASGRVKYFIIIKLTSAHTGLFPGKSIEPEIKQHFLARDGKVVGNITATTLLNL